jgi:hypothetical protein
MQSYPSLFDLMKKIILNKKNLIPVITVFIFFSLFILLGSSIYNEYGVSTDEPIDYARGQVKYTRIMGGSLAEFKHECNRQHLACYYPPFFSILLYAYAPTGDVQSIYLHRHQLTFGFFALSVFIFFLIGKKIFKDWKIGLLGSLFLIISPTIFANSFYNPKDIPFLSTYIIAIYTMLLFLEKKNLFTAILHGLGAAMVISTRSPGLIILPITAFFYLFDLVVAKKPVFKVKSLKDSAYLKAAGLGLVFLAVTAGLTILFFPLLYTNPIENYIKSFTIFKQFPWEGYHLFLGENISNKIPWYYSAVWFSISSPFLYVVLFVAGSAAVIYTTYKTAKSKVIAHFQAMRDIYLAGMCGILPILAVIVMKSVIYSNNRQMYFCYPPLLLVSLYGFTLLLDKLKQKTIRWQVWTSVVLVLGLAYPVYFMVRYHPNENVFFNFLAGTKMSVIKGRFSLDNWGLSVKQGLEFIARTDASKSIRVRIEGSDSNYNSLSLADRTRIKLTDYSPEYIIWYYRYYPLNKVEPGKKVYSVRVGDTDIMSVYKQDPPVKPSPTPAPSP